MAAAAAAAEDFTFPISADTARAFIDSPPLWRRVSPTQATSTSSTEETEQLCSSSLHTNLTQQRKSFSDVEGGFKSHHGLIEVDGHDRMDLLWEDFNEELCRNHTPSMGKSAYSSSDDDVGLLDFGCVPAAFNLSKAVNGGAGGGSGGGRAVVASNKKVGVVVLAKVLKRLFLLRQQHVKKRSW